MRGGSIPLLAWGTLLFVLFIGNWIWNGKAVNAAEAAFAALVIYAFGVALWLARRESIRRGPPEPTAEPQTLPEMSLGAVLAALGVASIVFGLAWANFLVYFGAGLLLAALGRLWIEVRAQRATRARISSGADR